MKRYGVKHINIWQRPFDNVDLGDGVEVKFNTDILTSDYKYDFSLSTYCSGMTSTILAAVAKACLIVVKIKFGYPLLTTPYQLRNTDFRFWNSDFGLVVSLRSIQY